MNPEREPGPESRSQKRRVAAQKGEPAPDFSREPAQAGEEAAAPRRKRVVWLPVAAQEWVGLQASFPLTEEEWNLMMNMLQVMKPGLVQDAPAP